MCFSNLNTTGFTVAALQFTVHSSGNINLSVSPYNAYNVGSIYTSDWCNYTGLPQTTTIKGNLSIPYGSITTNDVIYGLNNSS